MVKDKRLNNKNHVAKDLRFSIIPAAWRLKNTILLVYKEDNKMTLLGAFNTVDEALDIVDKCKDEKFLMAQLSKYEK